MRPDMGCFAWREQRIAWLKGNPSLSNFDDELAFHGIKPFILIDVQVSRWAAFCMESVFDNKNAVAVWWNDFEVDEAYAEAASFSEVIVAGFDEQYWRNARR